jgi:hypothetical protein
MGIPASGQPISIEGMNFYRLKDGRVTDIWTQFDGVAMGTRANARTCCWPVRVTRTIPPGRSSSGTKAAAARSPRTCRGPAKTRFPRRITDRPAAASRFAQTRLICARPPTRPATFLPAQSRRSDSLLK